MPPVRLDTLRGAASSNAGCRGPGGAAPIPPRSINGSMGATGRLLLPSSRASTSAYTSARPAPCGGRGGGRRGTVTTPTAAPEEQRHVCQGPGVGGAVGKGGVKKQGGGGDGRQGVAAVCKGR